MEKGSIWSDILTCSQIYKSLPVLLKVSPEGWSESRNSLLTCVVNAISNESTSSVHKAVTVDQLYSLVQPSIISPLLFASNLLMFSVTCTKLALTVWDKLHTADNECTGSSLWRHSYCNWQWPGFHQEVDCPQRQQGSNQCFNQSVCSANSCKWNSDRAPG